MISKLGELFTIKNHAYQSEINKILIGADAEFTPPIMVVCEILHSNGEHDTDSGAKETNQVRGIFYSHKTHKYEKQWFKVDEIKLIESSDLIGKQIELKESLPSFKDAYRNKQVILKSAEIELGKEKISQETRNFENVLLKKNPYLNFTPPAMTVIDIRRHETIKDNYHKNTGNKKRSYPKFELKCKYYNPYSSAFSEEWIPFECVADIDSNFDLGTINQAIDKYFFYQFEKPVPFEDTFNSQIRTVVKLKEIVFYHYRYKLIVEDICTSRIIKINLEKGDFISEEIDIEDLFENTIPNTKVPYPLSPEEFNKKEVYEIDYLSDRGVSTKRLIYIVDKYLMKDESDTIIVANCFLRNGRIRHFKVDNVKRSRKLKEGMKDKFITATKGGK